jgi:N-acetylglucosamine malate deacetylase 1
LGVGRERSADDTDFADGEPMTKPLSIVAIGAHIDDCWLAMGGTALKAERGGHRVTMVQAVSKYGAWPVVSGRGDWIKPVVANVAKDAGVKLITLGYDYMRLVNGPDLVARLVKALAKLKPDILFCHWEDDSNRDHAALGAASRVAAMHGSCFLPPVPDDYRPPTEIYHYKADAQARNFSPDTFVDITDTLYDLTDMCAEFDSLYSEYQGTHPEVMVVQDHLSKDRVVPLTAHTSQKFAVSLLDGFRCGVRFAEGFKAYNPAAVGKQLLGTI